MPPKPNRMLTRILLMAGTVTFALLPLYLTAWRDAIYDGAFLILAVAFSSDAVFRCVDPANRKDNWNVLFAIGSMAVLALALLQYGPIANDLRKEKVALQSSIAEHGIQPIAEFERQRDEDESALPNSSAALLISSILVEFSVIVLIED